MALLVLPSMQIDTLYYYYNIRTVNTYNLYYTLIEQSDVEVNINYVTALKNDSLIELL